MKFALTLLLVGAIAVAGAWFFVVTSGTGTDDAPPQDTTPTTTAPTSTDEVDEGTDSDGTANWQIFESESEAGYVFTLRYPEDATINKVQDTIYELKFIGPDAEPNTEITDGYYISMVFAGNEDLPSYSERSFASGAVTDTTFSGYAGITFTKTSMLSGEEVQHWAIAPQGDTSPVLDVSAQVYGDTDGSYQETVDQILESIEFESANGTGDGTSDERIQIEEPARGQAVESPISLSGEVRGTWLFEATAPVVVVDWDGRIIGESYIEAEGDWMTEDFVPFTGSVSYEQELEPYSASGTVIFRKSNPSGLPENDAAVEVPVVLE